MLIPIAMATFDDYRSVAAVPVPAAMQAAVAVAELRACTAKFITITELASISVAITAYANANSKVLRPGYGRCRNGYSGQGGERNIKLSHVPSSLSCPREKRWNR
jgi:hypothetical protein